MAASRPVGRAAYRLSNVVRCNSPLSNVTGATYTCGYCSQQIAHSSSTTHICTPTHTPSPTPPQSPLHAHAHASAAVEAVRKINRRTELDFEELRALQMAGDIALIDVRDPTELQNYGEIPGSLNIPLCKIKVALQLSEDDFEQEFRQEKPDKGDRNLVFYARGPNASSTAVEIAHRLGFKRSRHYIGGWEDYCRQMGMPLKKPQDDGYDGANFYANRFDQYFL